MLDIFQTTSPHAYDTCTPPSVSMTLNGLPSGCVLIRAVDRSLKKHIHKNTHRNYMICQLIKINSGHTNIFQLLTGVDMTTDIEIRVFEQAVQAPVALLMKCSLSLVLTLLLTACWHGDQLDRKRRWEKGNTWWDHNNINKYCEYTQIISHLLYSVIYCVLRSANTTTHPPDFACYL